MNEHEISKLLNTYIPYNTEIEKMGLYRERVCCFNPSSQGSKAFIELWKEVKGKIFE